MNKYQRGKIYRIISTETDLCYIGSTTEPTLARRLAAHVNNYKAYSKGKYHYISSFEILKLQTYKIVLIENFPCLTKDELRAREQFWVEFHKNVCVNINNAIVSDKKVQKQIYYQENKEIIRQKKKEYAMKNKDKMYEQGVKHREKNKEKISKSKQQWYEQNKEKLNLKAKDTKVCDVCLIVGRRSDYPRHCKRKYHNKFVALNQQIEDTTNEYNSLF